MLATENTTGNSITQNSIHRNLLGQIIFIESPTPIYPQFNQLRWDEAAMTLIGNTCSGCVIEVFSNTITATAGEIYLTSFTADSDGNFTLPLSQTYPYLATTVTDDTGTTSPFIAPSPAAEIFIYLPLLFKHLTVTNTPVPIGTSTPIATITPTPTNTPLPTPSPTPTSDPTLPTVINGDFESGSGVGWTEYSLNGFDLIFDTDNLGGMIPHEGDWAAWLGGFNLEISDLAQPFTLPADSPIFLQFYYQLYSNEPDCGYDFAWVAVDETLIAQADLCVANNTTDWTLSSIDLSTYGGQTVSIHFIVQTDLSNSSSFFIDDVSFSSSSSQTGPTQLPLKQIIPISKNTWRNPYEVAPNEVAPKPQRRTYN